MDKELLAFQLALIYTDTMFRFYAEELDKAQMNNYSDLTNKIYCLFEESYIAFLQMKESRFDFSDIAK